LPHAPRRPAYPESWRIGQLLRGGSWLDHPRFCRSAYRNYYHPVNRDYNHGFRVRCLPQD